MGERIVYFIVTLIGFGVLSSCTVTMVDEYRDSYSVFDASEAKGIIVAKRADKGLFSTASYYADVLMYEGNDSSDSSTTETRVTGRQMKTVDLGEEISGYTVNGRHFHTFLDMVHDGFFYLLFITLGILFMIGIILIWLYYIKKLRPYIVAFVEKIFELPIVRNISFTKLVLIILGGAYLIFASTFTINLFDKLNPFGKETAKAEVTFKTDDFRSLYVDDSRYYLTLDFLADGEYIEVTKEVSSRTYSKYTYGDTVEVSYVKRNPYKVFIKQLSILEIISSFITIRCLVYVVPILFAGGFAYFDLRKKLRKNKAKA